MVAIKLNKFGGMIPAVDDTLLPDNAAARVENAWLYSGAVIGLPEPQELHEISVANAGKVYRIPFNYAEPTYLFDSIWLEFQDANTDVIRAPVFNDTFDRYYWASSSAAPKYNTRARIANADPEWLLGINPPNTAPAIVVMGGVGADVTRAYVYTWVTAYGEESAPSPPLLKVGKTDGSWDITLTAADADDIAGPDRNLTHVRIYRTVTSISGVATYFFVAEQLIADVTYSDVFEDDEITENEQLASTSWTPPPVDLQGFLVMPNGIVAGFRENELWFSEPYRPHAWPVAYVLTVEYPIVGLGIVNQTLVVGTTGFPMTASGATPGAITTAKLTSFEPCISRGSILSSPEGVYFASPNGLILVNPGRADNITRKLITREKWQEYTRGTNIRAARLGTAYYAFGSVQVGIFEEDAFDPDAFEEEDFFGALNGILIDPMDERVAFGILTSDTPMFGVQNDPWSGEVFLLKDDKVYWLEQSDSNFPSVPYLWKSKIFQTAKICNLAAMKIYFRVPNDAPTLNPVRDTASVQTLDADQYGLVRLYAGDDLVMTREIRTSGELLRIPSGFKSEFWQLEIEARVRLLSIQMASSPDELKAM